MRSGSGLTSRHILRHINVALLQVTSLVAPLLVVANRALDRILGKHRAVQLHRRKRQLLSNFRVLDRTGLIQSQALDTLGHVARAGDGRATAEGLEAHVLNNALLVDLDRQLHNIATSRSADKTDTNVLVRLQERTNLHG